MCCGSSVWCVLRVGFGNKYSPAGRLLGVAKERPYVARPQPKRPPTWVGTVFSFHLYSYGTGRVCLCVCTSFSLPRKCENTAVYFSVFVMIYAANGAGKCGDGGTVTARIPGDHVHSMQFESVEIKMLDATFLQMFFCCSAAAVLQVSCVRVTVFAQLKNTSCVAKQHSFIGLPLEIFWFSFQK